MSIKLLSFDLDDTLWPCWVTIMKAEETLHSWFSHNHPLITSKYTIQQLWQKRVVLKQQNSHLAHDISAIRYLSLEQLAAEIKLNNLQTTKFVAQAFDIYYQARNQVQLFDDVLPVLNQLQNDYQMVGVSNGNADINRTTTGLDKIFQFSWSAAQAGKEKPHPKIFYDIMEKTALHPHNIIHIGDDPITDIQGASNAGIRSIWLNRDNTDWPQEISPAEYEINTLHQLMDVLARF